MAKCYPNVSLVFSTIIVTYCITLWTVQMVAALSIQFADIKMLKFLVFIFSAPNKRLPGANGTMKSSLLLALFKQNSSMFVRRISWLSFRRVSWQKYIQGFYLVLKRGNYRSSISSLASIHTRQSQNFSTFLAA